VTHHMSVPSLKKQNSVVVQVAYYTIFLATGPNGLTLRSYLRTGVVCPGVASEGEIEPRISENAIKLCVAAFMIVNSYIYIYWNYYLNWFIPDILA
jgi:hypothetical protein